ncbi:MAG: enoyl-CoA hydratase [Mycobacterium sp.]|nr:enoyl-CoA hydratase [Mycobacterium sp.]
MSAEAPVGSAEAPVGDAVLYEVRASGVAVITLNRPEQLNSWGPDISRGVYTAFDRAEADRDVRVIVLTGTGRGFCAGAYLGTMAALGESITEDTDVSKIVGERHPHFLTELRKPVIAAINGACVGIGLTHALMCDVRFAAAGAKFATAFPRRGLVGEYGITWILPRLAGWGAAADLLLSGRTFRAEEAAQLGLVKEVVAPEDLLTRALEYADDLAQNCSPASMAIIKRQLYGDANHEVADVSSRAEALMHESMLRPDLVEGITAFFEKRAPNFPPLKG